MGVSLMFIAIPLAIVGTIKANKKIEAKKEELAKSIQEQSDNPDIPVDKDSIELPVKEVIKSSWLYYVPTVVTAGLGAYFNISSTKEGLKRTAAMAAAYKLSEAAVSEWQKTTKEVVGDKKNDEIRQRVMKDRMELFTDDEGHVQNIYDTRDGSTLCFDYWSGRYFYSDIDFIKSQINQINETTIKAARSMDDAFATLNDVYRAVGLPETPLAEDRIWRFNKEGLIELRPSSCLVDDRPCWVLAFANAPMCVPPWMMDRM